MGGGLGFIVLLVVVASTIWVGVDASHREWPKGSNGTGSWVVGCLLLWIIVFPWYLSRRGKVPLKAAHAQTVPLPQSVGAVTQPQMYRECPHCKEPMRRDADTCPHCRQPSTAWRFHEGRWWYRASPDDQWHWLDERTGAWNELAAVQPPS